jgi:hypothetical protein
VKGLVRTCWQTPVATLLPAVYLLTQPAWPRSIRTGILTYTFELRYARCSRDGDKPVEWSRRNTNLSEVTLPWSSGIYEDLNTCVTTMLHGKIYGNVWISIALTLIWQGFFQTKNFLDRVCHPLTVKCSCLQAYDPHTCSNIIIIARILNLLLRGIGHDVHTPLWSGPLFWRAELTVRNTIHFKTWIAYTVTI